MINIGIDLDGVLADLISAALNYSELKGYTKEDVTEWDFFQKHEYTKRQQRYLFCDTWANWRDMGLRVEYKFAAKLLKKLKKKYRVSIITHRDNNTHVYVTQWLYWYDIEYHDLLFVGDGLSKFEFPINCLIDDSPKAIEEAKRFPNKQLYLVNQPWNKNIIISESNIFRVDDLGDAINKITNIRM